MTNPKPEALPLLCPFCGSHAESSVGPSGLDARCSQKVACADWMPIENWNRRTPSREEEVRAEVWEEAAIFVEKHLIDSMAGEYDQFVTRRIRGDLCTKFWLFAKATRASARQEVKPQPQPPQNEKERI